MDCRSCGRAVPDGVFCTACGADQRRPVARLGDARRRTERFAAHPDEPVFQVGVLTTLLPHLDHDRVDEFRWALLAGLGVIVLLYVGGLVSSALLVAAILVPLLYVLYLYEIRTYRDAPVPVFGMTLGAGAVLGFVFTVLANLARPLVPPIQGSPFGVAVDLGGLFVVAVAIPVVREIAKPIPALLLRERSEFSQRIDGLVFGVAAGLGFALAETLVQFAGVFASLGVRTEPADWIYPLFSVAVLTPLLHGSSTGVITAALWRQSLRQLRRREIALIAAAVASQVAFAGGSQIVAALGLGQVAVLIWQALVVGALLIVARYQLHVGLLDEAERFGFARVTCPNCRASMTASAFCSVCGMALSASTGRVRRRDTSAAAEAAR